MAIHTPSGSILHERARFYRWQGQHNLSIKTFWGGRAQYAVDREPIVEQKGDFQEALAGADAA
jgi:hypothetical protein